jgi:hypothetical protein
MTAKNVSWNSTIAANGSLSFGYLANVSGTPGVPTGVKLNGKSCTVG